MKRLNKRQKLLRKLKKQRKALIKDYKKLVKRYKKFTKNYKKTVKNNTPVIALLFLIAFIISVKLMIAALPAKTQTAQLTTVTNPIVNQPIDSGPSQSNTNFATYPSWLQNFADSKAKINSKYWSVYQGVPQNSNKEAEYYDANNVTISNGALNIKATKQAEPAGYQYGSGLMDTQNKVSFLYGRIDITATVPTGVGAWPAIWLLPANNYYEDKSSSSDPTRYLNGGELDVIEEVGFQPNVNYGIIHTLDTATTLNGTGLFSTAYQANGSTTYYTYSMLWTPNTITFEINNQPYFTYTKPSGSNFTTWPFDQPFYLIMNLAIGGSWGGEDTSQFPGSGIDNSIFPMSMSIKSIYYYPYIGAPN